MIIRVHLEATTVCRGIAVFFEPCILLVSIQKNAFMRYLSGAAAALHIVPLYPETQKSAPPPARWQRSSWGGCRVNHPPHPFPQRKHTHTEKRTRFTSLLLMSRCSHSGETASQPRQLCGHRSLEDPGGDPAFQSPH